MNLNERERERERERASGLTHHFSRKLDKSRFQLERCTFGSEFHCAHWKPSDIYTHYHYSNLIWRTVSRRYHRGHTIGSSETRSVEGDPLVWPHSREAILYARSSYYYDNMFIICLFSDILSDFKTCFGL